MFRLEDAPTAIDANYAYIGTFITFLERIVKIMGGLVDKVMEVVDKLSAK